MEARWAKSPVRVVSKLTGSVRVHRPSNRKIFMAERAGDVRSDERMFSNDRKMNGGFRAESGWSVRKRRVLPIQIKN